MFHLFRDILRRTPLLIVAVWIGGHLFAQIGTRGEMIMANRVFSVAAVMLGASALMSSLAVTPAAAWTYHRHVRVYSYAPAHYVTVHPVYRYGYHAAA